MVQAPPTTASLFWFYYSIHHLSPILITLISKLLLFLLSIRLTTNENIILHSGNQYRISLFLPVVVDDGSLPLKGGPVHQHPTLGGAGFEVHRAVLGDCDSRVLFLNSERKQKMFEYGQTNIVPMYENK